MQVYGGINPYDSHRFGFGYIDIIQRHRAVSTFRNQASASDHRDQSIFALQQVMRMREAVKAIKPMMLEPRAGTASATATIMQSTEEVNATPTSYSTHSPEWTGSTSQATLSGEYDGSNGSGTLTFRADDSGTHGEDDIRIKVYNSNNDQIDQFDIKKEDPIDKQYTLENGLTFSLGEGELLKNTTFSIEIFDSLGTAVDPDKPFNGTRDDDPNLEPGLSVSDGSFQIIGSSIDVNAGDSINDVLDRINQSDAGVTATFDAATEKVLLTQNTTSSAPDIVLENDTSGFLAAVKLDGATATPREALVQGVSVVDVTKLVVESIAKENAEKPWEIQTPETTPVNAADSRILSSLVNNMANAMNRLFDDSAFNGSPGAFLERARNGIRAAVSTTFGSEGPQFNTNFGISFDFEKPDKGVFNFSRADQSRFEAALSTPQGAASVRNTLFGTESDGLFNRLHATLTAAGSGLENEVGSTGLFMDVSI